jgi:hypothetical protein
MQVTPIGGAGTPRDFSRAAPSLIRTLRNIAVRAALIDSLPGIKIALRWSTCLKCNDAQSNALRNFQS